MLLDVAPLRKSREFPLLYAGQTVSFFGSMLTYVAIPYQVFQLSHSSFYVGLLGAIGGPAGSTPPWPSAAWR
jgi:hypothetical protein